MIPSFQYYSWNSMILPDLMMLLFQFLIACPLAVAPNIPHAIAINVHQDRNLDFGVNYQINPTLNFP